MSNGSFSPFAIAVFAARGALRFTVDFVSLRARRIAMAACGGKNDARCPKAAPARIRAGAQ
jgi:hypothetical protein